MVKHIVFDFGGVILDLDGVHTGYPDDLSLILDLPLPITKHIWNSNKTGVMTGVESPKDFLKRIAKDHELMIDVNKSLHTWEKRNYITKERIDWDLVLFIKSLNNNYGIHMLTDQIPLDNGASKWKHEFEQHFHTILRSYEQGYRKPDKQAYLNLLDKIGAQPKETIFIDDNALNIQAAKEVGMYAVQYQYNNKDALLSQFRKYGVYYHHK